MTTPKRPFGAVTSAMVTPFNQDGSQIDFEAAKRLAKFLTDRGNDGLIVNGTTGESATTTDEEKNQLISAVKEAIGDRPVVAGVGSNNTLHTLHLAEAALAAGADGLLLVTPYYNKPSQAGVIKHTLQVADLAEKHGSTVMLYDIPGRSGIALAQATRRELAQHPAITTLKDATGDLGNGIRTLGETDLTFYSGDDGLNLPWLSVGAVGIVSVAAHLLSPAYQDLIAKFDAGENQAAAELNAKLQPIVDALMGIVPGAVAVKAALHHYGVLENSTVRGPLCEMDEAEFKAMLQVLEANSELIQIS